MSPDETKRLLAVASSLKARILFSLGYGCGLRAGEVVRLKVKHIDSAQRIIRIEQSKGRKDRNVMLSTEMLELLREWWKVRPSHHDAATPMPERCGCFPDAGLANRRRPVSSTACSTRRRTRPGAANIERARQLLAVPSRPTQPETPESTTPDEPRVLLRPCPCCGGRMIIIETFACGCEPKRRPTSAPAEIRIDTS